jgi:hypothetical protein
MSFAVALPSADVTLGAPPRVPRRLAVVALVGAMAWLAAAAGWPSLVPRATPVPSPSVAPARSEAAPIDPDAVVEAARHPIVPAAGALTVHDDAYSARFDDAGFRYRLTGAEAALGVSLQSVARGAAATPLDIGAWAADRNVASRLVAPGVTERVTARNGEIEWDVVLAAPLRGTGDLVVRAAVSGAAGRALATDDGRGVRIGLTDGGSVRMGEVVVRDATGAVLHRAPPTLEGGSVELRVPARALDGARYPLTVDPTVNPTIPLTGDGTNVNPSLATDGSDYLVVWQEIAGSPASWDIYAIGIGPNGGTTPVIPVATSSKNETVPDVAWNGSTFLVVWELQFGTTDTDIQGRRVSNFWAPIGAAFGISTPTSPQHTPAVAATGSNFLVTWQDARAADTDIWASRVDTNGVVLDSGFTVSDDATIPEQDATPDVASNGTWWLVTWASDFNNGNLQIQVRLIDASGGLGVDNAIALFDQGARDPAVASDGTKFMVVWEQPGSSGMDIRGATVPVTSFAPSLFTGEQFPVAVADANQLDPAIAYRGTYLVAYRDERLPPDPDVRATRLTSSGTVQDPDGFFVAVTRRYEDTPAVAPGVDNNTWGLAYESGPDAITTAVNYAKASK